MGYEGSSNYFQLKKLLLLFLFPLISLAQTEADYRRELVKYEGYSEVSYRDKGGYSTGIGHHIYGTVKHDYSPQEIEAFFQADLKRNLRTCRETIYRFDSLPIRVKYVCLGIAWGVGDLGFIRFEKFRAALSHRNYKHAAKELKHSEWFHQVSARRSSNYISILKNQ